MMRHSLVNLHRTLEPLAVNNVLLQDLNLSTERLGSNKAFTNKLWNAGKFILQNLPNQNDTSSWEALMAHKVYVFLGGSNGS